MRIEFDMTTCSRCGGEGRLVAFSGVHGGVCFKCNGVGKVMTPAGKRAFTKVREVQKQVCMKPASQVQVGERIIGSDGKSRTVTDVKVTLGKGNGATNDPFTHETICLTYGETAIRTQKNVYTGAAHRNVTVAWTNQTLAVAAEAVKKYKGAKVIA